MLSSPLTSSGRVGMNDEQEPIVLALYGRCRFFASCVGVLDMTCCRGPPWEVRPSLCYTRTLCTRCT